jgi:hypothetical protein
MTIESLLGEGFSAGFGGGAWCGGSGGLADFRGGGSFGPAFTGGR